jgi:hypothetical protein
MLYSLVVFKNVDDIIVKNFWRYMMTIKKILTVAIVISLALNGWLFYHMKTKSDLYHEKFIQFADDTTLGLRIFIINKEINLEIPDHQKMIYHSIQTAQQGARYADRMYDINSDIPVEVAYKFQWLSEILELKYLPVAERMAFSNQPVNDKDKKIIIELSNKIKEAGFPTKPIKVVGWKNYLTALDKFLASEGYSYP